MYVSKFRCNVLYAWMSVDGIQTCVDGVAEAMVAVRQHSANAARTTPTRWMFLLFFFMVPPVLPTEGVPQGGVFRPGVGCPLREIELSVVPG